MGWLTAIVRWAWVNPGLALLAGAGLYVIGDLLESESRTAAAVAQGAAYIFLVPGISRLIHVAARPYVAPARPEALLGAPYVGANWTVRLWRWVLGL
jgi:hypothetical protein